MQLFWCRHSNFLTFVFWVLGNKKKNFWHESNFVSPNKFWLNSKEQPWSVQHSTTLHWEDLGGLLSPQKETPCFDPDNETTLLRVILTMTFQNNHVRFYVSPIASGEGRHTTYLLKCVRLLSTSQTDWRQSSNILWHIFWQSFRHSFWHSVWHSFWHIFWHSFWHIFWHSFWHISSHDCGWGPARNTKLTGSRLRSGTEHWTHRIAVGDEENEEKEKKKEKTTNIKSNNPHLTGGEKHEKKTCSCHWLVLSRVFTPPYVGNNFVYTQFGFIPSFLTRLSVVFHWDLGSYLPRPRALVSWLRAPATQPQAVGESTCPNESQKEVECLHSKRLL